MEKEHILPTLIFGSAGASKDVYYLIKSINDANTKMVYKVIGFVEKETKRIGDLVLEDQKIIASDDNIKEVIKQYPKIAIIIPFGNQNIKKDVYNKIKNFNNVYFPNVISPTAILDKSIVQMGIGNIIAHGVVFAGESNIGNFNSINLGCTIGHDVILGSFNAINPQGCISGNVIINDGCLIGANSTVLQELCIADNVTVGAGAVVTKDVKKGVTVVGIPAKEIYKTKSV